MAVRSDAFLYLVGVAGLADNPEYWRGKAEDARTLADS
jgi:hypothetical protein